MKKIRNGSMGTAVLVSILLVLLIIAGIWIYLTKTNKYIGLGETLRPYIRDVPVLNLVLPNLPDDSVPVMFARDELEVKYKKYYNETQSLTTKVEELEKKLSEKEDVSQKYEILLKEVDALNKQITSMEEAQKQKEQEQKSQEFKNMVKVYETMDTSEAAKVLEQIGSLNLELVIEICKEMKTTVFATILQEMDDDFAAILSERMISE